jgi:hypothetical protein
MSDIATVLEALRTSAEDRAWGLAALLLFGAGSAGLYRLLTRWRNTPEGKGTPGRSRPEDRTTG